MLPQLTTIRFTLLNLHPPRVSSESLRGDYSKVQPGDCIVAFSKADIFSIRKQVEALTPHKCAIIYGQLPPETRSTQARLFNESGSGYDVLVASDAIGMGLNLNIRRVVFHNTLKSGGKQGVYWVDPSSVKQIAGRAGRLSSDYKVGEVTAWQDLDLAYVRAVMQWDIPQISAAGVFPSVEQIELFSQQLSKTVESEALLKQQDGNSIDEAAVADVVNTASVQGLKPNSSGDPLPISSGTSSGIAGSAAPSMDSVRLSMVVERFVKLSRTDSRYFICEHEAMKVVSNWLHSVPLSIADRYPHCCW